MRGPILLSSCLDDVCATASFQIRIALRTVVLEKDDVCSRFKNRNGSWCVCVTKSQRPQLSESLVDGQGPARPRSEWFFKLNPAHCRLRARATRAVTIRFFSVYVALQPNDSDSDSDGAWPVELAGGMKTCTTWTRKREYSSCLKNSHA